MAHAKTAYHNQQTAFAPLVAQQDIDRADRERFGFCLAALSIVVVGLCATWAAIGYAVYRIFKLFMGA